MEYLFDLIIIAPLILQLIRRLEFFSIFSGREINGNPWNRKSFYYTWLGDESTTSFFGWLTTFPSVQFIISTVQTSKTILGCSQLMFTIYNYLSIGILSLFYTSAMKMYYKGKCPIK